MKKLAIIDTHPIQYNAPVFRLLAERGRVQVKVFYTWGETVLKNKFDPGFGKEIVWDIPLLDGYDYEFVDNVAPDPNASSFSGIDNPDIYKNIERYQPDFLLVFGWSFKTNLRLLRHYKGKIPIIFRGDSTLLREVSGFSWKKLLRRVFLTWVYRHIDFALFVGQHNRDYYLKYGIKKNQLVYAPHAVDNERFAADDAARNAAALEWRRRLGIPDQHIVVLFAGKLEAVKNVDYVLRLARHAQNIPVSFVIVGNGPEEERLKKAAEGIGDIHFVDFQNQGMMPVVYRMGDVVLLCSHSETWGLALNEAMACGRALAATTTCGAAVELIEPGVNGVIFEPGNTETVLAWLSDISSDRNRLKAASDYSRQRIQQFCFLRIAEALETTMISY